MSSSKPDWEKALEKFLLPLRSAPAVIGALLSGSRAIGTQTINSDIDLHIVLAGGTRWRKWGNKCVDGYRIEYSMNTIKQLKQYRIDDLKRYSYTEARIYALGRILFDKTGALASFQRSSHKALTKKLPKQKSSATEIGKHGLWDELDNLHDLHQAKSPAYDYCHKILLNRTIEAYRRFLQIDVGANSKIFRYFSDPDFRKRYALPQFPDPKFSKLFVECLTDNSVGKITLLVNHVNRKMGGFKLDGWKLRTPSLNS